MSFGKELAMLVLKLKNQGESVTKANVARPFYEEREKLKLKIQSICFRQLQETDYCYGCDEHSDINGQCLCIREIQ